MSVETVSPICLRPIRALDLDAVHSLLSDWNVVRHMLFNLCDREAAEHFVRESLTEAEGSPWRSVVRGIVEKSSDQLVGMCGVAVVRTSEEGELWYLLRPDHWGRGMAAAAARDMLQMAFTEMGLHRVWATVTPANLASARVLEKIGMRREGHLRGNLKIHGQWTDSYLYAMLDDEWRSAAKPKA